MRRVRTLPAVAALLLGSVSLAACADLATEPVATLERSSNTEGQGFNNAEGQGFNNTEGQGFNNTEGQGFNNTVADSTSRTEGQGFNN